MSRMFLEISLSRLRSSVVRSPIARKRNRMNSHKIVSLVRAGHNGYLYFKCLSSPLKNFGNVWGKDLNVPPPVLIATGIALECFHYTATNVSVGPGNSRFV